MSFRSLFEADASPINAASILPGLLERFGDMEEVLAGITPRRILIAAGRGSTTHQLPSVQRVESRFTEFPRLLSDWVGS